MTKHHENVCSESEAGAMTAFDYLGEQYLCASDWPTTLETEHHPFKPKQGWPWLDQLEWFEQLKQFESIHRHDHNEQYLLLRLYQQQQLVLWLPIRISLDRHVIETLSNYYSPEVVPVITSQTVNQPSHAWALIFQAMTVLWPHWKRLCLQPISAGTMNILQQMDSKQFGLLLSPAGHNWHATAKNKEEYWNKRQSKLINTIHRKKKKLQQQHADIQIYQQLTPERLKDYWHIYQHSWKQPEPGTEFIDWLLTYSSVQGQLRLGMMFINQQPVAFQFWLVQQQQAAIVKLAQDQAFDTLSPGTVLMAAMIDHVMTSDLVTEIDFLTGNDAYKGEWMDQCHLLYKIDVINCQHFNGQLYFVKLSLRQHLGQLKHKLLQFIRRIKTVPFTRVDKAGASRD
jgi:hypothetical protein